LQGVDRILGVVTAGGIGQDRKARWRHHVEQAWRIRVLPDIDAADRHRDDFSAAGLGRHAGFFQVLILAGADQQTRAIGFPGDGQAGSFCIRIGLRFENHLLSKYKWFI